MKFQSKLAFYNAFTKILIVTVIALLLPLLVKRVVYYNIDQRLKEKKEKFVKNLSKSEITLFMDEQKQDYSSYNILKEEYIILTQINKVPSDSLRTVFIYDSRLIEGEESLFRILQHRFLYDTKYYQLEIGESLNEIPELRRTIRYSITLILMVSIAISLFVDFAFSRRLLRPFNYIIYRKMKQVNDPVHFNFTKVKTSTDEFRQLDESLNQMMQQVKNSFLKEKQFIANVSHELLTPISILKTRFENLLNNEQVNEEIGLKIVASLRTLDRLSKMINNLLLISKIENAQYMIDEHVNIKEILKEITEEFSDRMEINKITIRLELQYDFYYKCNKSLIYIMLFNLINNALKYNKEGGEIILRDFYNTDKSYCLEIADTGQGMTEDQLTFVFNRFEKFGKTTEDSHGLGLAIVKSIAGFHHIQIQFESVLGKGTSVFLSFYPDNR